ncbi:MAG: hypothetical protein PCFJNLEI_02562 [Verrucomicrobiae bacterium]|nr:hypothetical protein [Verrucomicrobiae bacterium]
MMRWILTGLLLCGLMSPARADTELFNDGVWSVGGVTEAVTNSQPIAVSIGGVPAGTFSELKIYRAFTGAGFPQVFSIKGTGAMQPSLPPPGVAGGAFYLTGYWDCLDGLVSNLFITKLDLLLDPDDSGKLIFTGQVTNLTSMQATDFKMKFVPPDFDQVRVEISYTLYATRDICLDQYRQDQSQGFPVARMAANYVSSLVHQNDLLRYFISTTKYCDCCYCYKVKGPVCGTLSRPDTILVCYRDRLSDPRLFLANQDIYPANTPTLVLHFENPSPRNIRPQGFTAATTNAAAENVNVWGNWTRPKSSYKAGKRIGKFRFTLEATTPRYYDCDASACY